MDDEVAAVFGTTSAAAAAAQAQVEPLAHAAVASATAGMWRVRVGERSAVVKVLAHRATGGHENWRSGEAEDHWYYWRREARAYESGLLTSLTGGLRPPECHLIAERDDGSVALWLEDLTGAPGSTWPVGRYRDAARHLGRAQGEFVAGRPLPTDPWLSRGWLRAYLAQRDRHLERLDDPAAWRHPLVAAWFPDPPVDELRALRHHQDRYLDLLDALPPTLSHLDLHPGNLFDAGGGTAAIDWAFVGRGALGEDVGNLVPDAVFDFHVPPERLDDLYAAVAEGYQAGLQDAGADVTPDEVRLAMSTTMVAKYSWIAPAILGATSEDQEQLNGRPIADALASWAPAVHFLLARATEVDALSGHRP
ncbi:MAG TPA: hypothetical protein VK611_31060 [Acidimicrobiales bacterium]|nr:hypothetical protein [Acidimicrobiales bacterium]